MGFLSLLVAHQQTILKSFHNIEDTLCLWGSPRQLVPKFWHTSESFGGLDKNRLLSSNPRISDSWGLCGNLRMCISIMFPSGTSAFCLQPHWRDPTTKSIWYRCVDSGQWPQSWYCFSQGMFHWSGAWKETPSFSKKSRSRTQRNPRRRKNEQLHLAG